MTILPMFPSQEESVPSFAVESHVNSKILKVCFVRLRKHHSIFNIRRGDVCLFVCLNHERTLDFVICLSGISHLIRKRSGSLTFSSFKMPILWIFCIHFLSVAFLGYTPLGWFRVLFFDILNLQCFTLVLCIFVRDISV